MELDSVIVVLLLGSSGLFTAFIGHRIRQGELHLISGYRGDEPVDEDRLARSMGRIAYAVAVVTILAALAYALLSIGPDDQLAFWGGYTVLVLLLAGYAQVASRRARTDGGDDA